MTKQKQKAGATEQFQHKSLSTLLNSYHYCPSITIAAGGHLDGYLSNYLLKCEQQT